jgi:hypothetical protein
MRYIRKWRLPFGRAILLAGSAVLERGYGSVAVYWNFRGGTPHRYIRDKTITLPRNRLYIPLPSRIISQHVSNLPDGCVDPMLNVDEDSRLPKGLSDFAPRDEIRVARDQ